jgi:rod shape-determining protein MreD
MTKEILKYLVLFVLLIVLQVVVFNHLCLFNVAVPLIFIYFIIKLPVTLPTNWALTFSFLIGLLVDIFSNTQGMNALACTVMAACRLPLLRLYFPREEDMTNPEPSLRTLGPSVYMKYLITVVTFYCMLFFFIEAFTFYNWTLMLLRILASSLLTFIIILAFDSITAGKR